MQQLMKQFGGGKARKGMRNLPFDPAQLMQ
jgi:hypothetical protein